MVRIVTNLLFFSILSAQTIRGQAPTFFDADYVQEIFINFSQPNWDYLLDSLNNEADSNRLIAYNVIINGIVFDSVGVRYKGNSAYSPTFAKNPFQLKLDHVRSGADYEGMSTLKLNNAYKDPSFLREPLAYEIARQYMPAPQANYARVYVNGIYHGIYTNVESLNRDFRRRFFYSYDNAFLEADPDDIIVPGPGCPAIGGSALQYLGPDTTCYAPYYNLESDTGWLSLVGLAQALDQTPQQAETVLDVDRALWMLAFDNVLANLDSYLGSGKNYYLYQDNNARFNTVVWDLNEAFGSNNDGGTGGPLTIGQMEQLDPLHNGNDPDRPLLGQLLAIPRWRKTYLAHLRTILDENFVNGNYQTRALQLQQIIGNDVTTDPNKFFTNADFYTNLNTSVGNIPGITGFMSNRTTFLDGHPELSYAQPSIGTPVASVASPMVGMPVALLVNVSNANAVKLRYRSGPEAVFTETTMFDDGNHQDGLAGDGQYGAVVTMPATGVIQYYIYAENANAARLNPARAEFEFFTLTGTFSSLPFGSLIVNEFMAANNATISDDAGEFEDWIELHNNTNANVWLAGLYLTDNRLNITKFNLPDSIIAPGSHVVVWADEDGTQGPMHANFKLSRNGEELFLYNTDSTIIDSLSFGLQVDDISEGRCPDGLGPFETMATPTPGAPNNCGIGIFEESASARATVSVVPVPARGTATVRLRFSETFRGAFTIFDALGRPLRTVELTLNAGETVLPLALSGLPSGLYHLQVQNAEIQARCRFVVVGDE